MPRPFEPIGDLPRWRLLYELLSAAEVDEVVPYKELAESLDAEDDPAGRRLVQAAISRAARELLHTHRHAIEVVRNTGYRVVKPVEHLDLAHKRTRRAQVNLVKGAEVVSHVDLNGLTEDVRHSFEVVGQVFAFQMSHMRHLDLRQRDLDERLAGVQSTVRQTAQDQKSLNERVAWLEQQAHRDGADGGEPVPA